MWIFRLTSSDSHHLDTTVGEGGVNKSRPETKEATSTATSNVRLHGARISPILEAQTLLSWNAANIDDEGEDEEADNCNDLDGSKNELGFTIDGHSEDVQGQDKHADDGNPCCNIDVSSTIPKLDDRCSC